MIVFQGHPGRRDFLELDGLDCSLVLVDAAEAVSSGEKVGQLPGPRSVNVVRSWWISIDISG
jgi:hypothetical protein